MKDEFRRFIHLYKPNGLHNDWMSSILFHSRSEQCFQPFPASFDYKLQGQDTQSCGHGVRILFCLSFCNDEKVALPYHSACCSKNMTHLWGADMSKPLRCAQVDGSAKKHCFKTYNYIVFRHYWSLKNIFLDPPSTRKNDGFTVLPRISVLFHMFGYFFGGSR